MAATLFLVVQTAVYRHKIMGAYTSLDDAKYAIQTYLHYGDTSTEPGGPYYGQDDADGHHHYEICTLLVDQKIDMNADARCVANISQRIHKREENTYIWDQPKDEDKDD